MGIRIKFDLHDWRLNQARGLVHQVYRSRRILGIAAVCVLVVALSFHVIFGANGMAVYRQKRVEYRNLKQEIDQLQQENERYTEQIKALKSDPKAIEKEAREQLHYARPGEVVYIMPSGNRSLPNSSAKK